MLKGHTMEVLEILREWGRKESGGGAMEGDG